MPFRPRFLLAIASFALLCNGCRKQVAITAPPPPPALAKNKYTADNYATDVKAYTDANDESKQKPIRDRIVYSCMGEIDDGYGYYTKTLFSGKGAFGVLSDSEQLGLTAAATIATHAPTKTILSAIATGITGVNLSFDKNFFAQQSFQVIAVAMKTRRDRDRATIIANLAKAVADYPLAAARRDLVSYYWDGTLPGGLQELQEEAGAAAAKAQPAQTAPAFATSSQTITIKESILATPFTIKATGNPTPTMRSDSSPPLPSGIKFTDNKDGTATLSGTPAPGSHGDYTLSVTAQNGVAPDAVQQFKVTVSQ